MTSFPRLRKDGSYFIFAPTPEAVCVRDEIKERQKKTGKSKAEQHELVHRTAVRTAKEHGLREPDLPTLRSFYEIQFGQYQGQTFRWLVENAMGYTANLLCQIESEGGNTGAGNLNDNKRQLRWYIDSFPDGRAALAQKKAEIQRKRKAASEMKTSASALVSSRLPPGEIARRLQQSSPAAKKFKPNIPSTSVVKPVEEMESDDDALLCHVEALEKTDLNTNRETKVSVNTVSSVTVTETAVTCTSSSTVTSLQQLRTVSSVLESLKQPNEFSLPEGWKQSLPEVDKKWISRALCGYDRFGNVEFRPRQLWEHPPQPSLIPSQCPKSLKNADGKKFLMEFGAFSRK